MSMISYRSNLPHSINSNDCWLLLNAPSLLRITSMLGPLPIAMITAGTSSNKFFSSDLSLKRPDDFYEDLGEDEVGKQDANCLSKAGRRAKHSSNSESETTIEE